MKANAPERIYLDSRKAWQKIFYDYFTIKAKANDIEYIRADVFIDKAVSWLKEHREAVETEDNGIMGWIPDYFIEDFRKYMEE